MAEWWSGFTLFQQVMISIAAPTTIIILIQLVLILIGFSNDDSFDVSHDSDISDLEIDYANDEGFFNIGNLKIVTVRGVLAFLSVGAWVAMALSYTTSEVWAGLAGIVAGVSIALILAIALNYALKLQSSGNLDYKNAIGKTATVYIRIPPKKSGKGKITMTLQERFVEIDAMTQDKNFIDTGSTVRIIDVENETTVTVERV